MYAVDLATNKEYLVDNGSWLDSAWSPGFAAVDGDEMAYMVESAHDGYVLLVNLLTGERKALWRIPKESFDAGRYPGVSGTVLALPYVYWLYSGDYPDTLYRFDTRDGSLKASQHVGVCEIISGNAAGLGACAAAGIGLIVVDFDRDQASLAVESDYQQANGMLSIDGSSAIWIDFRDPDAGGQHGSYDYAAGGEVYVKNLTTSVTTRLTFDSPNNPVIKTAPWASAATLAWVQTSHNPIGSFGWYEPGPIMVMRPGKSAEWLGATLAFPRPTEAGVVGVWLDPARPWIVRTAYP